MLAKYRRLALARGPAALRKPIEDARVKVDERASFFAVWRCRSYGGRPRASVEPDQDETGKVP
jgi:hypothetical protein